MQNVLARVRNPALRQGLIFGIVLGVILVGLNFIITGLLFIAVLTILAAFLASMRASKETGRITTGILAGLWTGLIGTLILSIISTGFLLINIDAIRKNAQINANQQHLHTIYTNSQIISNYLIVYLVLIALGVLFSLMGGALGSSFGRRRAPLPPVEEYHEANLEPTSESPTEEPPSESQIEELPSETPSEEPPSKSQTEELPSETPSEESSSLTQPAE